MTASRKASLRSEVADETARIEVAIAGLRQALIGHLAELERQIAVQRVCLWWAIGVTSAAIAGLMGVIACFTMR
ncbi:hypothetical protein [Cupriavidus sp. DF5525]|uniref:hypothetical protein n=1 Tax=Cupriavidus sp. DF5525 TaxID=3160989 RepID=UPI0032DF01B1